MAPLVLAVVQTYALGYAAATKRAVLQSIAADLTTAYMTTGQENDLRLERQKRQDSVLVCPETEVSTV